MWNLFSHVKMNTLFKWGTSQLLCEENSTKLSCFLFTEIKLAHYYRQNWLYWKTWLDVKLARHINATCMRIHAFFLPSYVRYISMYPLLVVLFLWWFLEFWRKVHGTLIIENESWRGACVYYGNLLVDIDPWLCSIVAWSVCEKFRSNQVCS